MAVEGILIVRVEVPGVVGVTVILTELNDNVRPVGATVAVS